MLYIAHTESNLHLFSAKCGTRFLNNADEGKINYKETH